MGTAEAKLVILIKEWNIEGMARMTVDLEQETDGRWPAEIDVLPGAMAYEPTIIAKKVSVKNRVVHLALADGSTHGFPVAFYPRLALASEAALKKVKLRLGGKALRWENLDEDIWIGHAVVGRYPAPNQHLAAA